MKMIFRQRENIKIPDLEKYVLFRVQRNFLIKDMIQIWKMKILKQLKSH